MNESHPDWMPPTVEEMSADFPALEVKRLLAQGGMSAVYLARQTSLDRKVVLKVLPKDVAANPEDMARLKREAKLLAKLRDPGIVEIYDAGTSPSGFPYLLLEYEEGGDLRRWAHRREVTVEEALGVGESVAASLAAAHGEGVIHGDIKPDNIFLDAKGRLKVGDFGLADFSGAAQTTHHTPGYTAPEILAGYRQNTPQSDLYALAATIFELLFDSHPPEDLESRCAMLTKLPLAAAKAIETGLAADPSMRPASAEAYREILRQACGAPPPGTQKQGASPADPQLMQPVPPTAAGQRKSQMAKWIGAFALLVGGGAFLVWKPWDHRPGPKASLQDPAPSSPPVSSERPIPQEVATPAAPTQPTTPAPTQPAEPDSSAQKVSDTDLEAWLALQEQGKPDERKAATPEDIRAWNPEWTLTKVCKTGNEKPRFSSNTDGDRKVLVFHPPSRTEPLVFTRSVTLPPGEPKQLSVRVGAYWIQGGDWELRAFADDQPLSPPKIISAKTSADRFDTVLWDLSQWQGKTVNLRLEGAGGGERSWYCEQSYWSWIRIEPLRPDRIREPASLDLAQASKQPAPTGFINLFDAEHLPGWERAGQGGLSFEAGVATTFTRPYGAREGVAWYARQAFGDFVLQVDFLMLKPTANSGITVRFPKQEIAESGRFDPSAVGAVEIDIAGYTPQRLGTGTIAWSKLPTSLPLKLGEWNHFELTVMGSTYKLKLNGEPINEWTGGRNASGYLGLQFKESEGEVSFRNLWIKPLGTVAKTEEPVPKSAAPADVPPEVAKVLENLAAFVKAKKAQQLQAVAAGRKSLAGVLRQMGPAAERTQYLAEAGRIEKLDPAQSLLTPDQTAAALQPRTLWLYGQWKEPQSGNTITFEVNGKGMGNGDPMQWRLLDEHNMLIVHSATDPNRWLDLGAFSYEEANIVNIGGAHLRRSHKTFVNVLSGIFSGQVAQQVRDEEKLRQGIDTEIIQKREAVIKYLTQQLAAGPAALREKVLAQAGELAQPIRPQVPTPEERAYPSGDWRLCGRIIRFAPGGELRQRNSTYTLGRWLWAHPASQEVLAFSFGQGKGLTAGLARFSTTEPHLMRIHLLTGEPTKEAWRFGQADADLPPVIQANAIASDPIVGRWLWHGWGATESTVEFFADGSAKNPGARGGGGSWKRLDPVAERKYEVRWTNGAVVRGSLTADGKRFTGVRLEDNVAITADRVRTQR